MRSSDRENPISEFPIQALTSGPKHHFFGYFDHSPWSFDGNNLLITEVDFQGRIPTSSDLATILVASANGAEARPVSQTHGWNFQQGALANWVSESAPNKIWFNDKDDRTAIGCVLDITTGDRRVFDLPFGDVDSVGRLAVSMNFGRIRYPYAGVVDEFENETLPANDGVRIIDLVTGESHLVCSLIDIEQVDPRADSAQAHHWIEHVLFSPNGEQVAFFHRYESTFGSMTTRLMCVKTDGTGLKLFRSGMVSHASWKSNTEILAWSREPSKAANFSRSRLRQSLFIRPLVTFLRSFGGEWYRQGLAGDRLTTFNTDSGTSETLGAGVVVEDGHFSYSPDGRYILGDTYPDRESKQSLFIYDPESNVKIDLGSYASDAGNGLDRCDLHPRWSRDGRTVAFDSVHAGGRQMYSIDVSELYRQ